MRATTCIFQTFGRWDRHYGRRALEGREVDRELSEGVSRTKVSKGTSNHDAASEGSIKIGSQCLDPALRGIHTELISETNFVDIN